MYDRLVLLVGSGARFSIVRRSCFNGQALTWLRGFSLSLFLLPSAVFVFSRVVANRVQPVHLLRHTKKVDVWCIGTVSGLQSTVLDGI